jgi:glycosyltransferase involved in cell wall biosynthesis
VVLDHVDPLSLTWAQRARGPEGILRRRVAGLEADRLRRWERTAASWSAAQLILTDRDADALPQSAPVHVVPHVVVPPSLPARDRDIDVVFTGNMGYPPNRTAAMWLDREIAPELWRLRPGARIVVAGRDAHRLRLRRIERLSDVSSIPEILARARVAIVPLTQMVAGVPTKALEAALCGAALVVTPSADQRLALPARVAEDAAGLAAEVAALLDDPAARDALADEARCAVAGCGLAEVADQLDRLLASLAAENEPVLA